MQKQVISKSITTRRALISRSQHYKGPSNIHMAMTHTVAILHVYMVNLSPQYSHKHTQTHDTHIIWTHTYMASVES